MIQPKDFTKADEAKMPDEAGLFLCVIEYTQTKKVGYLTGQFSPEKGPDHFLAYRRSKEQVEVIAWVQIPEAHEVAEQFNSTQDEKNI